MALLATTKTIAPHALQGSDLALEGGLFTRFRVAAHQVPLEEMENWVLPPLDTSWFIKIITTQHTNQFTRQDAP